MNVVDAVLLGFVTFIMYMLFVLMPYNIYADASCLAKGYPDHRVTIGLEVYCLNLDGSITVNVEKLDD